MFIMYIYYRVALLSRRYLTGKGIFMVCLNTIKAVRYVRTGGPTLIIEKLCLKKNTP